MLGQNLEPPLDRLVLLLALSIVTGVVPLLVLYFASGRRLVALSDSAPVTAATAAMVAYAAIGMVLGLSFWSQYLLGLLPAVALASAALASDTGLGRSWLRRAMVGLVAASGAVSAAVGALIYAGTGYPFGPTEELVGWLRSSARADDEVVVTYGGPNLIAMSGLDPAYPYLWSLGVRTLDPDLERLERTLRGPSAPVWVVEWNEAWAWELDDAGDLRETLARHYDQVATVCELEVHLREDVTRTLPWTGARCDS